MQESILIIDSCSVTRQAYKSILSQQYALLFAETAQKGLRTISDNVRLTFLDMALAFPDVSGFEALFAIKQSHPSMPVVMTTSDGSEEKYLAAFRSGARDYIKKPFSREELIQKTEQLMNVTPMSQGQKHFSLLIGNDLNCNDQDIPRQIFESIRRVIDYIMNNCSSPFNLDDACKIAHMNRSYLCYYFKLVTGYTFKCYISHTKMQRAMELIGNRRLSITKTAQILGYSDLSSFSYAFTKLIGMTPKQIKSVGVVKINLRNPK